MAGTARRRPNWACFGMHEWAMVLGTPQADVRHARWPLRPDPATVEQTVSNLGLRCTHFDAYRFFTESAMPRNWKELTPADQLTAEQPACLHAGMDLYRWAATLQPLTSSDLVLRCLRHAFSAREIDMRASPYDLRALGYEPIAVECPEGRAEYVQYQRELHASASRLRDEILAVAAAAQIA